MIGRPATRLKAALTSGGKVRGLNLVGGTAKMTRKKLDELTEFWSTDGRQFIGFFCVETEATLKQYDRFESMYSLEYFEHIRATEKTGRTLAEIMKDLRAKTLSR